MVNDKQVRIQPRIALIEIGADLEMSATAALASLRSVVIAVFTESEIT